MTTETVQEKAERLRAILPDKAERALALWKSGRAKYDSFFTVLNEVRQEVGDDELPSWCLWQLGIGISRINEMRKILAGDDAARVKEEFEAAAKIERERKAAEAHKLAMEKIERENALAAKRAENAEALAAETRAKQTSEEKRRREEEALKKQERDLETRRRRAAKKAAGEGSVTRAKKVLLAKPDLRMNAVCEEADCSHKDYDEARKQLIAEGLYSPKRALAAEAADAALFEQYVEEGLAALKAADQSNWVLGDLAIKVSGLRVYGAKNLETFAHRIDVSYKTLQNYMGVAKAWSEISPRGGFSICRELAAHPDRAAIVAADPHMTCENAREIMRKFKGDTVVEFRKA